ncbi:hydrolase [Streptococcus intermedius BA1]|nr:hydrolase [Streptococcus intermedius BA1]
MEAEEALQGLVYGGELYRDDLNKVSFILRNYQGHLESKAAFPVLKAGTWGGKGEHALFGDLGVKDITKTHAIEVLLQHLHAGRKDTLAFGDPKVRFSNCAICHSHYGQGHFKLAEVIDLLTGDVYDCE